MCLNIDTNVKELKGRRTVWKVFDKETGKIASLYRGAIYPKGEVVARSLGTTTFTGYGGQLLGTAGLHFYLSKARALEKAKTWYNTYIAKFSVDPKDFMFASVDGNEAMYERAKRIGNYIKVGYHA